MADEKEDVSRTTISNHSNQSLVFSQAFSQISSPEEEQFNQRASFQNSAHLSISTPSSPNKELSTFKDNSQTRESQSLQAQLKERLYDKPENSGVMQYVRLQTLNRTQISGGDAAVELPTLLKQSKIKGHLPTNRSKWSSYTKAELPSKSATGLSVQEVAALQKIITRKRPAQLTPLNPLYHHSSTSAIITEEGTNASRTKTTSNRNKHEQFQPDNIQKENLLGITDEKLNQEHKNCQQKKAMSESLAVQTTRLPEDTDLIVPVSDSVKAAQDVKSQSTSHVFSKKKYNKEQASFKKNKYDDKVPEKTNALEKLMEMRKNLGWVVEIPRHGPTAKEKMYKLKDITHANKEADDAKEDDGEFFYCLPTNRDSMRAQYNPYDLEVVSANTARSEKMFFTISASHVTMCYETEDEMKESNVTPALWWLWERRLFYKVFQLPFFMKFRLWKTFKQWKHTVHRQRNKGAQEKLYRSLFTLNEVLQGCLIHVRSLCENARNVFKDGDTSSIISLVDLEAVVTMTLQKFESIQKNRCDRALQQLTLLRENIVHIVWESCTAVSEMEGISQGIRDNKNNEIHVQLPVAEGSCESQQKKDQETGHGEMTNKNDKVKRPLFAEISKWRKILARLSCFLQCVDYILQDLLRYLVFSAVQKLRDCLVTSYHAEDCDELDEKYESEDSCDNVTSKANNPMTPPYSGSRVLKTDFNSPSTNKEEVTNIEKLPESNADVMEEVMKPVFSVSLILNVPSSALSESSQSTSQKGAKDSAGARLKWSLPADHDVDSSSNPRESDNETESESEYESEGSEMAASSEKRRKYVYPSVTKMESAQHSNCSFVMQTPSAEDFHSSFQSLICYFEDTVTKVTPMLREPKLAVFYTPPHHDLHLLVDDEEAAETEATVSAWPDLDLILRDDPVYQSLLSDIFNYLDMEMKLLARFSTNYDIFCKMINQCRKMHVEESISKRTWTSDEFSHVLHTYLEMIQRMNRMPTSRRVAFVQVEASEFQSACLPYPTDIVDVVSKWLPVIANRLNDELMTIIKSASKRLDQTISNVEDFVDHLSFLGHMAMELPALEKEHDKVNKIFTVAKDHSIHFQPEEMALYQTLSPSFQHLKSTILYCEAMKDENIRKFATQLEALIANIRSKLKDLKIRVHDPELLHADAHAISVLETIRLLQEEVQALSVKARSYATYQDRFGSSLSKQKKGYYAELQSSDQKSENSIQEIQTDLSEIERDLNLRRLLWQSLEEWSKLVAEWTMTPFDSINVEALQKNVNNLTQTVFMLEKGLPHNEVVPGLKERVLDFKQGMPVITSLRNPFLKQRHWEQIQKAINKTISHDKTFTLGNLLELNIFKHKERIQEIAMVANNEATLEQMLQKVIDLWQKTDFRLVAHAERETLVISGADDIMAQVEESLITIGTVRGSKYVTPIKAQVEEWERKLQIFSRTLDEWLTCQRNWLYLEQIFSTPDIQRQLPAEFKLFMSVDKAWKDIMKRTADHPNALKSAITAGTLDTLQMCNTSLEKVQKCLEDYLETKRLIFPRFYFLSNDELLDILAQSKDPNAVQPHLLKCFDNIRQLDIQVLPRQPPTVKSMLSSEKEVVIMPRNVRARGPVEQWLGTVEAGMFETVKKHMKLGLTDRYISSSRDWVLKHPGQVVLTVTQIVFNKEVTKSLESSAPIAALKETQENMVDFLNQLASFTSARLLGYQRLSIEALLTITVHNRDIIMELIDLDITRKEDFQWNRQLRYEWDETVNSCQVLQSNACFQYGYEYLGCSARLVMTPLTDRCYLTLTGALTLHLGGSPAGPAGTGKTETVKDLAKAMGKQCVVFNCSEGLDYKMLGRFFSGLAQSGSWCCFDEFNRIDVEVLSVVAMQIHTIKSGKDAQSPRFLFEGRDIKLNPSCGYFITMNPSYAGRVELPDNLKYLFRPVAMMVPDYTLIAEIMLFSEGFTAAKSLSQKIVNLYQLASRQLSQQDHYDFGMRAIKSVLVMAGHGRRKALQKICSEVKEITEKEESYILIHSLRDANLPKFLAEDVPLFESIVDDLFPGIVPPDQDHGSLEKAISISIRELNLQQWPNQIDKVKQLYNQILVRHGVMLVGPTGGGKTSVRNILQRALALLPALQSDESSQHSQKLTQDRRQSVFYASRTRKGHVETFVVNPKCVTLGELYGETDPNTFEWSDGLIANATRKFSRDLTSAEALTKDDIKLAAETALSSLTLTDTSRTEKAGGIKVLSMETEPVPESSSEALKISNIEDEEGTAGSTITDWRWLILDGPVDTMWVENLNTVLDDSKVLCLANGERISLATGMRLMFEVDSLSKASPATVSRCAMVYMDSVDLGWKPYVTQWLCQLPKAIPESGKSYLQALFDASMDKGMNFLRKYKEHQAVPAPDLSIVGSLCHILSAYADFIDSHGGFGTADVKEKVQTADSDDHTSPQSNSDSKVSKTRQRHNKFSPMVDENAEDYGFMSSKYSLSRREVKVFYLEKNPTQLLNLLGKLFVFAYTWSIGGVLKRREFMEEDDSSTRRANTSTERVDINNEFDSFVRELFDVEPPLGVRLPAGNCSIYGYFVDMESGSFVPWDVLVPGTKSLIEKGGMLTIGETLGMASDKKNKEITEAEIIPTVDIVRFSFLASLLLVNKHAVLLTGESGVGKTAIINHMLKQLEKDGGTSAEKSSTILGSIFQYSEKVSGLLENISNLTSFHHHTDDGDSAIEMLLGSKNRSMGVISTVAQCSAQTTSKRLEAQIMLKLIKKSKTCMGAPKGRKMVMCVDDLNMPAPDIYGAQPPLELLRQFLEMRGFYDTKKLTWKDIQDVTVVAACGPPGGGRNSISPRLLKHFSMFTLPQPSTKSLQHIYQVQLGRFLKEGEFMPEVQESLFPLVSASIAIYYHMCSIMLPTPTKSHYTFNIRDLSKVIQGMLQAHESVIVGREHFVQLFAHETTRVFHDRLTCSADRTTFFQILADNLHAYFKVRWTPEKLMKESVLFGDFSDPSDHNSIQRIYRPLSDQNKLERVLEEYHMRMNMGEITEQLVFFKDVMEHVVRAARVFRQPGGHLLMVGLDGTGKSTVIHLASYISNCEMFRLKLHNQYGSQEFQDDLKTLCLQAGVKGIPTVLLLTDSDIVKESFIEDINCILNSGEVPDLFDNEELDGITMDLRAAASDAGFSDAKSSIYAFFIQRIRQKLHVVLAMSPAGDRFRQRCRMNPALVNCCTIDWFDDWTDEAMLRVARVFFADTQFIADESVYNLEKLTEQTAQISVKIHKSISDMSQRFWEETRRHYYSTPSSYMELIRLYSRILADNKHEFTHNRNRLRNGLSALSDAYAMVGVMQEELVSLGPVIIAKAKDTEDLLKQLEEDRQAVKEIEDIVSQEENIMSRETQIVQDYADECESDLTSVLPVLQDAITSLETLDKASISELRVYTNPPQLVATVIAAVCVLFQKKTDWATGKLFIGDPQFLRLLLNFDRHSLPDRVYAKLKKYTKDPNFNPETVGKVSLACKCICSWVLAIDNYNTVFKMVKPKQKRVQEAREALQLAQESLARKQESLHKIQNHLKMIEQQYEDSVTQREALKERQKVTGLRLERASILISALADEEVRWSQSVKFLDIKLEGIVGDTLVTAASVAYLGAFTAHYRNELVNCWVSLCQDMHVPISEDFDVVKHSVDASQVMKWHNCGLPKDRLSVENATFITKARKWPLLIDPQGQGLRWIREMEGPHLKIVAGSDTNIMQTVVTAIRVGAPCLLKDVGEELDPALRPVLLQETFSKGGQQIMKIGDVELEYNKNFRLYLTTSLANPHYLPDIFLQVNVINFMVTFDGLQEQLLSVVVTQERPTLEKQRSKLLESIATDKQVLVDLENRTLSLLASSEGHLLDDQGLVETLQQSKTMSQEIHHRVAESEETEQSINLARKRYMPVATRGSVIYFVVAQLTSLGVMYQYSLAWFQSMFLTCISDCSTSSNKSVPSSKDLASGVLRPASARNIKSMHNDADEEKSQNSLNSSMEENTDDLKKHLQMILERLTYTVYRIVSVGLFSHHKLIFSFLLCSSIMQAKGKSDDETGTVEVIQEHEWHIFLHGSVTASLVINKMQAEERATALEGSQKQTSSALESSVDVSHDAEVSRLASAKDKSYPPWISASSWQQCQCLEFSVPAFHLLCQCLWTNHQQWEAFRTTDEPFMLMGKPFISESNISQPAQIFEWFRLTKFQQLLLIKALRLDMLASAVTQFIQDQLGAKYLSSGTFDLHEIYAESLAKSPLIFILSPGEGCDPSTQLLRFAKDLRGSTSHLDMISLGRGQGPKAEELISKAQILKGRWVVLQNCHLAASWMPRLQNIVEKYNNPHEDSLDPQFRLWLSSMPDPAFPVSILQSGIKMTIEAPRGLKANLLRTFGSAGAGIVTRQLYDEGSMKSEWHPLLYGLCLFNSIIHERKKYGSLGWNICYEFNDSDLEVSILKLQMLLEEYEEVPWVALIYLTSEVIYGGRVTDDWDRRCLKSLLVKFYNPAVFQPGFCYDSCHIYTPVPEKMNFDNFISFVKELPDVDSPEIFGMTESAEKACREFQSTDIVNTVLSIHPRRLTNLSGSPKSSDALVLEMAEDITKLLPRCVEDKSPTCDPVLMEPQRSLKSILQKDVDTRGLDKEKIQILEILTHNLIGNSALLTVLRQEVDRFNNLLSVIHSSLNLLILAVKGEIVMSGQVEDAYEAMLSQAVPAQWKVAAYESRKPLSSWVVDLKQRVQFFADWAKLVSSTLEKKFRQIVRNVKDADTDAGAFFIQPSCFWLSAFFFPQGFLTAVLQNHARKLSISVDSLTLRFQVMKELTTEDCPESETSDTALVKMPALSAMPTENGVLIDGLFLDGARWDSQTHSLQNCATDQRFCDMPKIHFEPVERSKIDFSTSSEQPVNCETSSLPQHDGSSGRLGLYECPLYRTSARAGTLSSTGHSTNFVTSVTLPSDHPSDFWILRGVAMLCQLDN